MGGEAVTVAKVPSPGNVRADHSKEASKGKPHRNGLREVLGQVDKGDQIHSKNVFLAHPQTSSKALDRQAVRERSLLVPQTCQYATNIW